MLLTGLVPQYCPLVSSSQSLLHLKACSAERRRPVQVWLKQPLVKVEEIQTRHDIVDAFVTDPHLRQSLRDEHFRGAALT